MLLTSADVPVAHEFSKATWLAGTARIGALTGQAGVPDRDDADRVPVGRRRRGEVAEPADAGSASEPRPHPTMTNATATSAATVPP
ncbi:MAG TPA: hypothetical protein VFI46_18555, partial [Jiangellaceae bacterium]|nr:hypothetical protein [Jiangellaceae bacterium]